MDKFAPSTQKLKKMRITFEKWGITDLNGYTPVTTLWQDFQIAEAFGKKAIMDTAKTIHNEYKDDVELYAEFVLVLNHRCWALYSRQNEELSKVYADLYYKHNDYALDHFKGKDFEYYFNVLD